jgi:hypothetical protein
MRPSVFFQYRSGKYVRDRPVVAVLRPALLFAGRFFLLTVAVLFALIFTAVATRAPLPPGPAAAVSPAPKAADILADIRHRWPVRLVPPEWIIKPEAGDALIPTEVDWLRVEGRARLFVIVTMYLLSIGFLYRRQRRAAASNDRAELEGHTAGKIPA